MLFDTLIKMLENFFTYFEFQNIPSISPPPKKKKKKHIFLADKGFALPPPLP